MNFSTVKDSCQHDEYCGLSKTVCVETNFKEICRMKDENIENMPLLNEVKKSVARHKKAAK